MATATKTKPKSNREFLPAADLERYQRVETVLRPGAPYLWIMTFGWAKIGFYVKHVAPNRILIAHCNHFRNAGKDYGKIIQEGLSTESNAVEWRYEGELVEITTTHILETAPYNGKVNRSGLISLEDFE
jgi:hypothetical protein